MATGSTGRAITLIALLLQVAGGCSDGGRGDGNGVDSGTVEQPRCESGCRPVYGRGEDVDRGCVDRARVEFLGCDCHPGTAHARCGRRTKDDSLWSLYAGELSDGGSQIADCTAAESDRVGHACDFEDCDLPPLSTCSLKATCPEHGCGGLQYDELGCRRSPCTTDADCGTEDRCVPVSCADDGACAVLYDSANERCMCSGPLSCREAATCNPVSEVGPAGEWRQVVLELFLYAGPSAESSTELRSVDVSGALTITRTGPDAGTRVEMLSESDLKTLGGLIDGPELRAGLRDGFECGIAPDSSVTLTLELTTTSLSQSVTGCALIRPPDNDAARLYDLLTAY